MRGGLLRQRVTIQQKSASQDSFGQEMPSWSEVATVWASVEPLTGREFLEGASLDAEISARIRIRYRSGVLPEMRAVHGSNVYNIRAVINRDERNRELHLMCDRLI